MGVLLITGISISWFTILVLLSRKNIRATNYLLSIFLFLSSLILIARYLSLTKSFSIILYRVFSYTDFIIYFIFPVFLFYINQLFFQKYSRKFFDFVFIIPTSLYLLFVLYTTQFSTTKYLENISNGYFYNYFFAIEFSGIATCLLYIIFAIFSIRKFRNQTKPTVYYHKSITTCLFVFLSLSLLSVFFWIASFVNTYILNSYNYVFNYNLVWISIPLYCVFLSFFSLYIPEKIIKNKNATKRISDANIESLKIKLDDALTNSKVYLKPNLSLKELSEITKISQTDLSWLLNTIYKKSFYNFINSYRIEAFLFKIKNNVHKKQTIISIAYEVGFNSKTSFYTFFKQETGETPSNFIKNIRLQAEER